MISKQLKAHFLTGEPVIQEFTALMNATFQNYRETRTVFFEKLPARLHQSELVTLINVELKTRLFDPSFCETIEDALEALRRVIIRLQDIRTQHPGITGVFDSLNRLISLAEKVVVLYQQHWEHYRYQSRLNEQDLVMFLLKIDGIAGEWEKFQEGHRSIQGLVQVLSGRPCPEDLKPLVVTYLREGPAHFATGTLKALMDFFEAGYRFVCAIREQDPALYPLTLLQVEVAEPVELHLGVPRDMEEPFRRLLQYLFLKDMLRAETLLKFVCDAIAKDFATGKNPAPTAVTAFRRDLSTALKHLPPDGRFTISDRTFPEHGIPVLQEFTRYLEEKKIKTDALLKAMEKPKPATKPRDTTASKPSPQDTRAPTVPTSQPALAVPLETGEKEHIRILTDNN